MFPYYFNKFDRVFLDVYVLIKCNQPVVVFNTNKYMIILYFGCW